VRTDLYQEVTDGGGGKPATLHQSLSLGGATLEQRKSPSG
jgi:hypothetical protein